MIHVHVTHLNVHTFEEIENIKSYTFECLIEITCKNTEAAMTSVLVVFIFPFCQIFFL